MKTFKKTVLVLIAVFSISTINAQEEASPEEIVASDAKMSSGSKIEVDFGVDLASRYIWRGLQFSGGGAIQPYIEMTAGNFTFGTWASYQDSKGGTYTQELDFYASYSFGPVSVGFTDYAFPYDQLDNQYFRMSNHVGEASLSFDGVDSFPLSVFVGINVYNDDNNSLYTEVSYPFSIKSVDFGVFLGAGNEAYTVDGDYAITNFGLSASKDIKVTDAFSFGASCSAIFNPNSEDAYLVFVLSI